MTASIRVMDMGLSELVRLKKLPGLVLSISCINSSEITFITFNNSYLGYMFLLANRVVIRTLCLLHVLQSNTKNDITLITSVYSKYQKLFQEGGGEW